MQWRTRWKRTRWRMFRRGERPRDARFILNSSHIPIRQARKRSCECRPGCALYARRRQRQCSGHTLERRHTACLCRWDPIRPARKHRLHLAQHQQQHSARPTPSAIIRNAATRAHTCFLSLSFLFFCNILPLGQSFHFLPPSFFLGVASFCRGHGRRRLANTLRSPPSLRCKRLGPRSPQGLNPHQCASMQSLALYTRSGTRPVAAPNLFCARAELQPIPNADRTMCSVSSRLLTRLCRARTAGV